MSQAEPGLGLHLYAQLSPLAPGPTSPLWSSVSAFYERRAISGLTPPMGASGGWRAEWAEVLACPQERVTSSFREHLSSIQRLQIPRAVEGI